jgi:hypothetical protein
MTTPGPFGTSYRRDAGEPRDLRARIDAQVRERIEEAVDHVCLQALVERRRARGLPAPAADSAADRAEYEADVRAFLERLVAEIVPGLPAEEARRAQDAARAGGDTALDLMATQVVLAKRLPDYWQRFDDVRGRWLAEPAPSGSERRGLLARLFGHG